MKRQRTIAERNATGWMHVYGQVSGHDPAEIRGTTEALVALRDALTAAIEGDGVSEAVVTASDGEGYAVQVRRINVLNLLGPLPYEGHTGREGWADWRHEAWKAPPEPFDPEIHRVIVFVDRDGGNASLEPPASGMDAAEGGRDRDGLDPSDDSPSA